MTDIGGADRSAGIDALFSPRTVAVVGASRHPDKLGHRALRSSAALGFSGQMFGVNPLGEHPEEAGWPMVRSLSQIDGGVDLAFVAVPAALTLDVVSECARMGVRAAVLAASGFGELGVEGRALETEIGQIAADAGMRLLGPNGFGLFVADAALNLTTWADIPTGRVALLTQSGNVAIALFRQAAYAQIGFSSCAGLGNQLDVSFADLVRYHAQSEHCDAVALYVEGLRAGTGRELYDALRTCRQTGKPVVVLKAGRSTAGAGAATTHTGALSGNDRVWDSALAETGAVRVGSSEEMVDVLAAMTLLVPSSGKTLVLTDGGGDSVLTLDALGARGVPLAQLTPATQADLDTLSPAAAPRVPGGNPVTLDTAGGLEDDPALIARCAAVGAADPGVDVVVVSGGFGGYRRQRSAEMKGVEQLLAISRSGTSVVVHSSFAADNDEPVNRLRSQGVPVYPTVQRLAVALAVVMSSEPDPLVSIRPAGSEAGFRVLGTEETASRLTSVGADIPPLSVVFDEDALGAAVASTGFPLCLKVEHPGVSHKSDAGGVRLDLGPDDLLPAAADLWATFPGAALLVMPMLPRGFEVLVGAAQDPTFGPVVTVGRGGVTAEVDPDVAVLVAPVTADQASSAWLSLRCSPLLRGWRGASGVDLDALARLTASISQLASADARLSIECNPVIAYPHGYGIADMRAVEV